MNRDEQLADMLSKVKRLGLEFRFESGILAVRLTRDVDEDAFETAVSGIADRAPEVRAIAEKRAIAEHAQAFIGSRIWIGEYGEGTLESVDPDGRLRVRVRGVNGFSVVLAKAESVVIFDNRPLAAQADAPEQPSEPGRKGLLQTVRDKIRGEA